MLLLVSNELIQVIDEISARSKDTIIGFGERLSCKLMATILQDRVRVDTLQSCPQADSDAVIGCGRRIRFT